MIFSWQQLKLFYGDNLNREKAYFYLIYTLAFQFTRICLLAKLITMVANPTRRAQIVL